jgi:hypothetical protein
MSDICAHFSLAKRQTLKNPAVRDAVKRHVSDVVCAKESKKLKP